MNFDFKIGFFHHGLASKVVNLLGVLDPPDFHITFGAVVTLGGFMSEKNKKIYNQSVLHFIVGFRFFWKVLYSKNKLNTKKIVGNKLELLSGFRARKKG